jgi:hypothetical protein
MGRVLLVGAGKLKADGPVPAEELYVGPMFRARRAHVERRGLAWFILSPRFGLLRPEEVIDPYELAMARQGVAYRRAWAERVVRQLVLAVGSLDGRTVEMHAGAAYVEPLRAPLERCGATVLAPLAGLSQGHQLQWYAAAAAEGQRPDGALGR